MNVFERKAVQIAWAYFKRSHPVLKRWLPLLSVLVLVLTTILRLLGYTDLADSIDMLRGLLGLTPDQETVALVAVLVTAVSGAGVGLFLKFRALWQNARAQDRVNLAGRTFVVIFLLGLIGASVSFTHLASTRAAYYVTEEPERYLDLVARAEQ